MRVRSVAFAALLALASPLPGWAGTIRGHVLETKSGKPVTTGRAYTFLPGNQNTVNAQAVTDSLGNFEMRNVPPGVITLRVQAAWYDNWTGSVTMGGDTDTARVEVRLSKVAIPGSASGIVTCEGGTKPGRHAHVMVKGIQDVEGMADTSGQYVVYNIPAGPQTLQVVALGYDMIDVPVLVEEARNMVVSPDLGRSLVGGSKSKPQRAAGIADSVGSVRFMVQDTSSAATRTTRLIVRHVKVEILSGDKVVRKLMDWSTSPGPYTVRWDGKDDTGKSLPAGTYRSRVKIDEDPPMEMELIKKS
ncbi:MAG TPA: carboxypeptidase regulatory-like domain-containing protein [Candidatus Eisenbacteria bacterium]|nr:carboxypeptidase regulatory-like domain-containing protein [Candidatus Eisenbacteria bacterium]